MPSTMCAGLSVADLSEPIKQGLSADEIHKALCAIGQRFNDPAEWGQFLASVDKRRP